MKTNFIISLIFSCLLLTGCYSEKDRLTHKWVVTYVSFVEPNPVQITESNRDEYWKMQNERTGKYIGRTYDIQKDGSFSMSHKDEAIKGTWSMESGVVIFKADNKEFEQWRFHNDEIEIGHDTSLSPMANWRGENNYISLGLHPALGEVVKTDY